MLCLASMAEHTCKLSHPSITVYHFQVCTHGIQHGHLLCNICAWKIYLSCCICIPLLFSLSCKYVCIPSKI